MPPSQLHLASDPPHPQGAPVRVRIIPFPLLPRAMQLKANIMLLPANLVQLLLKRLLPVFRDPSLLKVGKQRIRRRSIVQVLEQTIHIVATNA